MQDPKYRIKQIGDGFYPQQRIFGFFWMYLKSSLNDAITIRKSSLDEAQIYLKQLLDKEERKMAIKQNLKELKRARKEMERNAIIHPFEK